MCTSFVDDAYIAISDTDLQGITIKSNESMQKLEQYMDANLLKLNLTKTAILTIPPVVSRGNPAITSITTPTGIIQSQPSLKILGVIFSPSMDWKLHVNSLVSQLNHKINILRTLSRLVKTKVLRQIAMEMSRYLKQCKTLYLPNYSATYLADQTERIARPNDLKYHMDEDGRLIRNIIPLKTYIGKA